MKRNPIVTAQGWRGGAPIRLARSGCRSWRAASSGFSRHALPHRRGRRGRRPPVSRLAGRILGPAPQPSLPQSWPELQVAFPSPCSSCHRFRRPSGRGRRRHRACRCHRRDRGYRRGRRRTDDRCRRCRHAIVARIAALGVIALVAGETVIALVAVQRVVPCASGDHVVAVATGDDIAAFPAEYVVAAGTTAQVVVAASTADDVVTTAAIDRVIPVAGEDDIPTWRAVMWSSPGVPTIVATLPAHVARGWSPR